MKLFKHCDSDVVDLVAGGSLRVASLAYFRHLEEDEGDTVAGDRQEGTAENRVDNFHSVGPASLQSRQAISTTGIFLGENVQDVTVSNIVSTNDAGHHLVFCLSMSPDVELDNQGYDACVCVSDPSELVAALCSTGYVGDAPFHEVFAHAQWTRVRYVPRVADVLQTRQALIADPFAKPERYSSQTEFRILLTPYDAWLPDLQFVKFTPPKGLLSVISPGSRPPRPRPPARPKVDVATDIRDLIEFLERLIECDFDGDARARRHELSVLVRPLYWEARLLGSRGIWEPELDSPRTLKSTATALARLCNDLVPGRFGAVALEDVRPRTPPVLRDYTAPPSVLGADVQYEIMKLRVRGNAIRTIANHAFRSVTAEEKAQMDELETQIRALLAGATAPQ